MAVIVVVGLRRSGTTALWRSFRQLPGFTGLYEPFNPKLGRPSAPDRKAVWADLRALTSHDPETFARSFAPIEPAAEASALLSADQASYLTWLLDKVRSPHLVLSMTRCGFKLPALRELVGGSTLLHISREPVGWIRSHLFPTEKGLSYARQRLISRLPFVRDRTMPRDYSLDAVVSSADFERLLSRSGIAPPRFRRLTPTQRLYLLWLEHEKRVELDATAAWPGSRMLVSHAQFVRDPERVLLEALALASIAADATAVHDACSHVRGFDAYRPPAGVTRRIATDIARLSHDAAIDTALPGDLAQLHAPTALAGDGG